MRLALAQINPFIGDFSGNCEKICNYIQRAKESRCDLVIFPELALVGYPPRDLLDKRSFVKTSKTYWSTIQEASHGIGVICGVVAENETGYGKSYHNSALFFDDGSLLVSAHKRLLPSYDVFDEERHFEPGERAVWVDYKGERLGLTICEDVWNVEGYIPHSPYVWDPVRELEESSVTVLINIAASPYHSGKAEWVGELLRSHAVKSCMQVVNVNQVGGNDELIFQGHSMVWDERGQLAACGADFSEDFIVYDTKARRGDLHAVEKDDVSEVMEALILGLRDYTYKCGFKRVVLGLSGGVDSALTASLAVKAMQPENVLAVAMPGPYSAPESLEDARELAERLGIEFQVIPITNIFEATLEVLSPVFGNLPHDVTEENLQARIRGLILMALSNKYNRLLLSTGNKSELAVGYCTLYGDMDGGLAVLGDVPKTLVYRLSRRLNQDYGWIPERTIERPPSAELRPDQKDQDTLPPYDVLDAILFAYVEKRCSIEEIVSQGLDREQVQWVINRVDHNEYKRWQAPPVLRVTTKAFGTGRRLPLAQGYRES